MHHRPHMLHSHSLHLHRSRPWIGKAGWTVIIGVAAAVTMIMIGVSPLIGSAMRPAHVSPGFSPVRDVMPNMDAMGVPGMPTDTGMDSVPVLEGKRSGIR